MEKYLIVIEKAENNFSAFSPDILGCVATSNTVEQVVYQMKEIVMTHLEALIEKGEEIPHPMGLSQHIQNGIFEKGEISDEYFITEVEFLLLTS